MARILLVDDEPTLLTLLRRYLEKQGHEVHTFPSGEAALQAVASQAGEFHLIVADLTLPGMSGADLVARMREISPGIPALIASGYPYVPQLPGVGFLQKPFLPQMLADEIARLVRAT